MKKILTILSAVMIVLAALPIIGNKTVNSVIEQRVEELQNHGVAVKKSVEKSGYLSTSKHYEFVLQDGEKFIDFLNEYAGDQIPPYMDTVIDGVTFGVDLQYSNIPFFTTVVLDLYPMDFSQNVKDSLKENDLDLYQQLEAFFSSKGLSYHMNYHMATEQFEGYVKDIERTFKVDDKAALKLTLQGLKFTGKGKLTAPESSDVYINKFNLAVSDTKEKFLFAVEDFQGSSVYSSKTRYNTYLWVKNWKFVIEEQYDNIYINFNDLNGKFSSDEKDGKLEIAADSSFKDMTLQAEELDVVLKDFRYELALSQLDKISFEKLQTLFSQAGTSLKAQGEEEIETNLVALFSNGFELNLKNISFENIVYNKTKELKELRMNGLLKFKADDNLYYKLQNNPDAVLNNVELSSELFLSPEIYEELKKYIPEIAEYATEDKKQMLFKSLFKNSEFSLNGKTVKSI